MTREGDVTPTCGAVRDFTPMFSSDWDTRNLNDRLVRSPAGYRGTPLSDSQRASFGAGERGSRHHSLPMTAGDGCQQARTLTDKGEVVVAAGGIGNGRAAIGRDAEVRQVGDRPTVDANRAPGIADADGVAGVATAVDVSDGDRAAVSGSRATPPLPAEAMSVERSSSPKNLSRRLCVPLGVPGLPPRPRSPPHSFGVSSSYPSIRPCRTSVVHRPSLPCSLPDSWARGRVRPVMVPTSYQRPALTSQSSSRSHGWAAIHNLCMCRARELLIWCDRHGATGW